MSRGLPSTSGPRHAIVGSLALVYGTFLAYIALWPSPIDRPVSPLLGRVIEELHERGVPAFVNYGLIEFSANIALFMPVGILLGLVVPLRIWPLSLMLGPVLSVAIEVVQHTFLSARYATVSDVIANSIGATIGVLIAASARALIAERDQRVIERREALTALSRAT
ncbi:MAG TPA: VanZ family protein [Glaciibacter sp.]|nr:VanZ family protein [Glaciibacter sp.]